MYAGIALGVASFIWIQGLALRYLHANGPSDSDHNGSVFLESISRELFLRVDYIAVFGFNKGKPIE
jgi:hypothetical protein